MTAKECLAKVAAAANGRLESDIGINEDYWGLKNEYNRLVSLEKENRVLSFPGPPFPGSNVIVPPVNPAFPSGGNPISPPSPLMKGAPVPVVSPNPPVPPIPLGTTGNIVINPEYQALTDKLMSDM